MSNIFDKALAEVGDDGKFQKVFDAVYNFGFGGLWAMAYMNIIMIVVIVPHMCSVPEKAENISAHEWRARYIPLVLDERGEKQLSKCLIYVDPSESNETIECDSYEFDTTWYKSTVPIEYGWVCDKEINIVHALTYKSLGEAVGSLVFGWFGDIYGRRITYILSILMLVCGRVISVLANSSFLIFTIGCIVSAFPSWSALQSVTFVSLEICSPQRRSTAAIFRFISYTTFLCIMPFFYWWLADWKLFILITTAPQVFFLIFSWKLIESPRWLWLEGKKEASVKILKQIAKTNGTSLTPSTEMELMTAATMSNTQVYGFLSLFSSYSLAFNTVLQLIIWATLMLNYTVLVFYASEKTDGNPFLDFAWQTAAEMPGNFLGAWLSDHYGRRPSGSLSVGATGVVWIFILIRKLKILAWMQASWIGTILMMTNRLLLNICFFVVSLLNMELYPTCLRQSGMSIGNVVTSGAAALAPAIIYVGHQYDDRLPSIILAVCSFIGMGSILMLPETLNVLLPETLEDAKSFGRKPKSTKLNLQARDEKGSMTYVAEDCD